MNAHPRRLGKYELQGRLGSGGMAEVWKSLDTQLKRYVAIKLLRADLQADPSVVTRFRQEAELIASLHHPNIVQIHDFNVSQSPDSNDTVLYMVMDYVEGQTLADFIRSTSRKGQIPSPATIVQLLTPISQAIDYAHKKGMIHRDIKPANILLDKRHTSHNPMGEPILSDFGIAKLLGSTSNTQSGSWMGTPLYIAPEQVMGFPATERSDIYSLGVILYEICTGVQPFSGGSPNEIMMQHVNMEPTAPSLINPSIPPALTAVILRALAKEPKARFASAPTMVAALAEAFNMSVPKSLNVPNFPPEALYSPTFISQEVLNASSSPLEVQHYPTLSSQAPSQPPPVLMPPSASMTPTLSPQPFHPASMPGIQPVASNSGAGTPPKPANNTPIPPFFEQSSSRLPVITAPQPPTGTAPPASVSPFPPAQKKRRRWLIIGLIAALIVILLGTGSFFFLFSHTGKSATNQQIMGHAFFISSGQTGETSNQGITDELQINLSNVSSPASGKSYYGWLEPDVNKTMGMPVFLGNLPVNNGTIQYLYKDPRHANLLATTSRFLITEEDSAVKPNIPSPDVSTWRYSAQFPQPTGSMNSTPTPTDMAGMENLGVLDHMRHLLSQAPELQAIGLPGGLDIWLFRNSEKVLEWSVSARDDWQVGDFPLMHRHIVRILDYLDGLSFVQHDAPGEPILVNKVNAEISLLDVDPMARVRGFLYTIDFHLNALIQSTSSTPDQRKLAIKIDNAVKNVELWLNNVRKDAQQLEHMSPAQLALPATRDNLLDTMANDALSAFAGRIDPDTGNVQDGVIQIHYNIQRLATFDIQPYTTKGSGTSTTMP